ncbi:MAG: YggT family protein [Eggerthellaceae bacterium]|uniref:YggT family protein n=1 Tax=Denitrobacterium detoxificans TaxID=79604 RepID=UPI0026EBBD06|nr:YggT family protein [Denitrobacterium detoxificans]MBE6465888.1 YggT family protein [Denitrobacterium detoxificans]MCR5583407.1 YggT family protein [Eggerthellaceae bacterium]
MVAYVIYQVGQVYSLLILVYCVLTWFPIRRDGVMADIFRFFQKICDPYLNLFRKIIPPIGGAIDVSPIIALVVLQLLVGLLVRLF